MKRDNHTLQLDLRDELIIDNFAGGGGTSTGLEAAFGRPVDVAINHNTEALAMHRANHPGTKHYCESVWDVDPRAVTGNQPVGLVWLSPDCKHFSKAKGGKPVEKKIRGLAWVALRWAATTRPRVIALENVEEFTTWGPLGSDGRPCPQRKGVEFGKFVRALQRQGYAVDWRELRACDYGAPTIRKRFFLIARRDGLPIRWPEPTHGDPKSREVVTGRLMPWRTAAECIDWSIPAPSIFERTRPLADATCRRIAKGVMRYVVNAASPFIVGCGGRMGQSPERNVHQPMQTITAKADSCLAIPTLIQTGYGERPGQSPRVPGLDKPLGTIVAGGQKHALVAAFIAKHYGGHESSGWSLANPLSTVTTQDHHHLVSANLIHMGHGEGKDGSKRFSHGIRDLNQPINTITASGATAGLITSHLMTNTSGHSGGAADAPLHTVCTGGHHAEVRAFLVKYYGNDKDGVELHGPLHTIPTHDRFGLVTVAGEQYAIADIGMRMLTPRELFTAQGFPSTYVIDRGIDEHGNEISLTKTAQVRMCGNSVCPPLAEAIVRANFTHESAWRATA